MFASWRPAVWLTAWFTLVTGLGYPALVAALAWTVFPYQAGGSLEVDGGTVVGSDRIGQAFQSPKYFWSRLSATAASPYNASASGGSNLGPTNPALVENAKARIDALRAANSSDAEKTVPVELVTASASGLDPEISPAAANYQVPRVAAARGWDENRVRRLVDKHTMGRTFGFVGEPRVHVWKLNRALDREAANP